MNSKILAGIALLALAPVLEAVRVKQVEKSSLADFQKGSFIHVSIDSNGGLSLGPKLKSLTGPAEEFYLSAAASGDDLYLGTGHSAAVYRLSSAGKVDKIFQGEQLDIYALLVESNGNVIVGTSPNGRVLRVAKDGKSTELFHPDEKFIWDLAEDKQGNIICALGNTGAVYGITKSGAVENLLTAEDAHIISLHVTSDNAILAGSGDRGILYEIKNHKVRVLFDSPLEEIKGITSDPGGNVYFTAVKSIPAPQSGKEFEMGSAFAKNADSDKEAVLEKSILYCLSPDGAVESLWSSTEELAYAVHFDSQAKAVVIGTGNAGRVYRVDRSGAFVQVCESDSAQVFRIVGNAAPGRGYYLISNNTAGITWVENGMNATGTYFSEVFDARVQSRFGRLSWNVEDTAPSSVSFAVRLGNSDYPDRSWTNWSAPFTDPENSNINTGGYRFLQVKIVLRSTTPSASPLLSGYRIHYLTDNLKPEIGPVRVQRPGDRKPVPETTPPRKYLHVSWEASDPNQDRLNFTLSLRKLPGNEWLPLRKDLREKWLYLDCELFADGKYQLRVQADDGLDNAPAWARNAVRNSASFIIDSSAPFLSEFSMAGRSVRFKAEDLASAVALAQYSLDGKEWVPVFPDDLVGDSRVETYGFELSNPKNSRMLLIKLSDEFGNDKVFQKSI